jgi:hypothetical protein
MKNFNNKNSNKITDKKFLGNFVSRLEKVEETKKNAREKKKNRSETDAEIEQRFAKMKRARAKERHGPARTGDNPLTYADLWDEVTDEEIDYYMRKALEVPPEQRYQIAKKRPPYHEYTWTSRGIHNESTGWEFDPNRKYYVRIPGWNGEKGCNEKTGECIPDCRFYPPTGRIEDDEVIAKYEKWKRDRDSITLEEKREARQRVHNYNLIYDDDDDTPEQYR